MTRLQAIFIAIAAMVVMVFPEDIQIKTQQGIVRGALDTAANNRTFYSFTGIPYAKPPLQKLRFEVKYFLLFFFYNLFQPPVEADPWTIILDATRSHPKCIQFSTTNNSNNVVGEEDCLYLNVYTPKLQTRQEELLPVMFYIHGGAFIQGSGKKEYWGPKLLLVKDIVLVSSNYRLGSLGFLSTGDNVAPGNVGLKDQAFALQWVKNNIHNFGGDPERITVFGHSAGGCSSHLHMLSPLTKSNVKGIIAQSGAALNLWGLIPLNIVTNATKKLADNVGCDSRRNTKEMITCLKTVPIEDIVNITINLLGNKNNINHLFRPVVEVDNAEPFLSKDPKDIIISGEAAHVPFMAGVTSEDGSIIAGPILISSVTTDKYNKNFNDLVPRLLFFDDWTLTKDHARFSRTIKGFYLKQNDISEAATVDFINMCSDGVFSYHCDKSAKLQAKYSEENVYYYLFNYKGSRTFGELYYGAGYDFGVVHGDELLYLFDSEELFPNYNQTDSDRKMSDVLVSLWTNFAYHGNPTPVDDNWKPLNSSTKNYCHIEGPRKIKMLQDLNHDRFSFWENLFNTVSH